MATLALALSGAGCVSGPDEGPTADQPAEEMMAKLVHSIDKGNGHTIEFYDLGDGQTGTKEQYVFGDTSLIDDLPRGKYSLADMYRHVQPQGEVPQAIVSADARAAAFLANPQPHRDLTARVAASSKETSQPPLDPSISTVQAPLAANCSADLFNDRWSAQWFVDNFCQNWQYDCNGSGFPRILHAENTVGSQSWAGGYWNWMYRQFEGDFNVAGSANIYRDGWGLAAAIRIWSGKVPPRNVLTWNIGGGLSNQTNHADGNSPCGHQGHVMIWCDYL
jgi:hypothetical protein